MKTIQLTRGKFTIVDDSDFELVNKFTWHANKSNGWYAKTFINNNGKFVTLQMHRLILGCPEDMQIDHINGDGLDNRRENLRLCNNTQNHQNRHSVLSASGYKGVYFRKYGKRGKYNARIYYNGKSIWLGSFDSPVDAAVAYDNAALKYFREFACTNKVLGLL